MSTPVRSRPRARRLLAALAALSTIAGVTLVGSAPPAAAAQLDPPATAEDSLGTDFWVAFPRNYQGDVELTLFISGSQNTQGTVTVPGLAFSEAFSVVANEVTSVALPQEAILDGTGVSDKGVHVVADDEVSVYGLSRQQFTTDAFMAIPVDALGTAHRAVGYNSNSWLDEVAVVATVDDTTVTIGAEAPVQLDTGQAYHYQYPGEVTGTAVLSDKPVAVLTGHICANIPAGHTACDHIVEQVPPTDTWGTQFVTMPLATRVGGDSFRIVAADDDTSVSLNGAQIAELDAGQFHTLIIDGPSTITSSAPVLVAQFSNGSSYDGVTSDPFMMLVPPHEQFLAGYTVTTPASGFQTNFINVVVPNEAVSGTTLDGATIPPESFVPIGSGFSGAQMPVALGSHSLSSPLPFGVFVYGFDQFDSYGYPGGMSFSPVATVTDLALDLPATADVGEEACAIGTLTNSLEQPVVGVRVDFSVTGANPHGGFANTDALGNATHCWTGTAVGTDDVVASVGSLSATDSILWLTADEPPTITKVADQSSVVVNGDTGYTITVANPNSADVIIDSLTDTLPSGFSYRPGTTTGATTTDPTVTGQVLEWAGPFTVPGDGEITLHFGVRAPTTTGTYFNEASFPWDDSVIGTDPTAPITVLASPVHVTKTADDSLVQRGAATGYTITVVNGGATPLALNSITDTLPAGFSYRAGTSSGLTTTNPSVNGRTLTWTGSFAVPAGGSRALHFGVNAATLAGDYFNEAGASATDVLIQPTGPTARITVADHLRTTKAANPQQVAPGGSVSYTITIANPLSSATTVTSITDTLPSGFTYKPGTTSGATTANPSINGRVLTWNGSWSVPAGGQRTLTFEVTAPSVAGTYLNEADAVAGITVKPTGPTAAVTVLAALATSKVSDVSTVAPGGTVGYTITVTNSNPTSHTLSAITDTLPAGFSYITNSTSGVTSANPTITGSTLRWPGAFFLPAGGSVSLHFLARAASTPGEYFNNAGASAGVTSVLPTGPTAPVLVALPMTLTAKADKSPVRINALAPHTITIVNPNSTPAPLVLSAELPAGFTYVAGTTTGLTTDDPVQAGSVLIWGGGDGLEVAPFSTATLRYTARASSSPGSYVTNVTAAPATGDEVEFATAETGTLTATAPIVVNAATGLTAAPAIAQIKAGTPTVNLTLSATLRVANSTRPVVGRRVTFKSFGLDVCSAVTDPQGVATCGGVIGAAQAVLGLGYRAVFAGDTHYLASSAPGDLVVVGSTRI